MLKYLLHFVLYLLSLRIKVNISFITDMKIRFHEIEKWFDNFFLIYYLFLEEDRWLQLHNFLYIILFLIQSLGKSNDSDFLLFNIFPYFIVHYLHFDIHDNRFITNKSNKIIPNFAKCFSVTIEKFLVPF